MYTNLLATITGVINIRTLRLSSRSFLRWDLTVCPKSSAVNHSQRNLAMSWDHTQVPLEHFGFYMAFNFYKFFNTWVIDQFHFQGA